MVWVWTGEEPLFWTNDGLIYWRIQYIPRNMHTVFALLCFVVVIHWLIFPYPSGLLHWHCGNLTIAPVPAKQPWWIWIKYFMWIHYERLHNHNKAKHNKTVCIFLGIYCICLTRLQGLTKYSKAGNLCLFFLCNVWIQNTYSYRKHCWHIEPETKWPPFYRRHFQLFFLGLKCMTFDEDFAEVCS